jgi:hypothetical protein
MHRLFMILLAAAAIAMAANVKAQQPQSVNVRGTVTAFDGKVISVRSRDGGDVRIDLPEGVNVNATRLFTLAEIKPGMVLGVTTVKGADGTITAIDVRPIPQTANLGLTPFDLQPGSTMTNAVMEAVVARANGHELTLDYRTGSVKVLVPPGTPMSQSTPGSRADIKPGEIIFVAARVGEGGRLAAARVQVSRDGIRPTQ